MQERLELRYGDVRFDSRTVEVGTGEDPVEACYDRGWSDGLPVVPPTPAPGPAHAAGHHAERRRSARRRALPHSPHCTIEKAAVNAVMAGCRPEYFPVVLAAVRGRTRSCIRAARRAGDHRFRFAHRGGERSGGASHRHEQRGQRARAGSPRERHYRQGRPARGAQRRGRPARRGRPFDPRASRQVHVLLCGGRVGRGTGNRCGWTAAFPRDVSTVTLFAGGGVHGIWDEVARDAGGPRGKHRGVARAHGVPGRARARSGADYTRAPSHLPRGGLGPLAHQVRARRGERGQDSHRGTAAGSGRRAGRTADRRNRGVGESGNAAAIR